MEKLVERAQKNDEQAFNELILKVQKEMYLIAKSKLKDEEDIADAIQETILACYKNLKKLRDNKLFKTWLIRILINECNDIHRKRKKNPISYDENECENYIKSEEETFENMGFDVLIRDLKEDEKMILTLYYCSGYSTKDIGKILKMKESTVRSKMFRAKEKLKNQYEGGYYE